MRLPYKKGTAVRLVSVYGYRLDPFTGQPSNHGGYDLVSDGDKTVCAVADGKVMFSRMITDKSNRTWEWGNYVAVRGDDGYLYYYCHLAVREVTSGEIVRAGDIIGIEGTTGRSTGSHLHLEIRNALGVAQNPEKIIGVPNIEGTYIEKEEVKMDEENKAVKLKDGDSVPSEWAKDAVEWAVENGIIYGDENGDLMLSKPCTREQMLVFLYRFAQLIGKA